MQSGPVNWQAAQVDASHLDVSLLGCVDFDAYLTLQDRLAVEIQSRTDRRGILLACEHPPIFTLGRDGGSADLPQDPDDLEAQRIPWRWVGRGGGTWRHGPGQLNVSIIVPLDRMEITPLEFRQKLIRSLLAMSREQRIPARPATEFPGVTGRIGQFAFIGAAVHDGVTQFGLIVNVAPNFAVISHAPRGVRSSSLSAERMKPIAMASVRESLIRHLADNLGYDESHVQTGHPWLRRTSRMVPIHA
jgi:lipoate-protein ligase B